MKMRNLMPHNKVGRLGPKCLLKITWFTTSKIFRSPNAKLPWRQHEIVGPAQIKDGGKQEKLFHVKARVTQIGGKENKKQILHNQKASLKKTHFSNVIESISLCYLILDLKQCKKSCNKQPTICHSKTSSLSDCKIPTLLANCSRRSPLAIQGELHGDFQIHTAELYLSTWVCLLYRPGSIHLLYVFGKNRKIFRALLGHIDTFLEQYWSWMIRLMVRLHYKAIIHTRSTKYARFNVGQSIFRNLFLCWFSRAPQIREHPGILDILQRFIATS